MMAKPLGLYYKEFDSVAIIQAMKQRGGSRKGAGRKKISEEGRTIRARVAPIHEQALTLAGNGSLSEGIRRLAEKHWRLIHGEQPRQSNSVFDRYRTLVRKSESGSPVLGGVPQVKEGSPDEPGRD
jgi:hypothetical protein